MRLAAGRAAALATALTVALAGCSAGGDTGGARSNPGAVAPGAAPGANSTPPDQPAAPAGTPASGPVSVVASGLDVPWGLVFLPDGSALVSERDTGRVLRLASTGGAAREVARINGVDTDSGEGGLLGLAVSPTYASDEWLYAYFTGGSDNRIVRFRLANAGDQQPIFTGLRRSRVHNGGRLVFGPDGMLYVGTGDAGARDSAQDPASPNGKILRLTADGGVPADNPRPGSPVFSSGHRNVQGIAFDSIGRLWEDEFGQNDVDEVNLIEPGRNYGWPACEGPCESDVRDRARYTDPVLTWPTRDASPSGAAIKRGLQGDVLYVAALRGERLWRVPLAGTRAGAPEPLLVDGYGRLRTVAVAPDGALWLTTSNRDGRGSPVGSDDRILRFPVD